MMTITINTKPLSLRALRREAICKGANWAQVKDLNQEELSTLVGSLKSEYITNPDETILKVLSNIQTKRAWHKLWDIQGGLDVIKRFNPASFNIENEDEETLAAILEKMVANKLAKLEERAGRLEVRSTNRSMYLPQLTLIHEVTKTSPRMRRWRFESDLISTGLLPRMLESLGHKVEGEPLSLRIVNGMPLAEEAQEQGSGLKTKQLPIPATEWEILRQAGWLPTQGNLAWNWRNPALKEVLLRTFPKAIDFGAYNHRLNAPLIPGGYFEDVSVRFSNPMAWGEAVGGNEIMEACLAEIKGEKLVFQRDQECDGAGLYDPDHPDMKELVGRYGKVVFQITLLRKDGLFAKGIIVPREGLNEGLSEPIAIHLDMAQVKGAWKGRVAEGQVEPNCFIGLMKAWSNKAYFPGSFELLEFIKIPSDAEKKKELLGALDSLVEEGIARIARDGIDGLMTEIARDDEQLKLLVKIIAQVRAYGTSLNPMAIPMIKAAIEDKLRAKLWIIAQGAALRGNQYVTVLDATVPEGTCVLSGYKIGSSVSIWRFPCVLPQGLVTCKVIEPSLHHLVDGKVVPNCVWLNPRDLTARMQGDDDGDIVGISDDPRVEVLFKYRATTKVYEIEPVGQKFDLPTNSPEGFKYLETDPRGPVGLTTIWQAQLLACGDWWGALALAVLNQEAIDAAKRKIAWTDVQKACEPGNWSLNAKGNLALSNNAKMDESLYEHEEGQPSGWPGEYLKAWMKTRLEKFGCIQNKRIRMNPLAWRDQSEIKDGKIIALNKRVNPSSMLLCKDKDGGFRGGNLVHLCHDKMVLTWKEREAEWNKIFGEAAMPIEVRDLLGKLMEARGNPSQITCSSWEEYLELRKEAGITKYGAEFKRLLANRGEDDSRYGKIEDLNKELVTTLRGLSPAKLMTIWHWELTPTWSLSEEGRGAPTYSHYPTGGYQVNKPNYAFRAISFPGSPILPLLGIDDNLGCDWITSNGRAEKFAEWILRQESPFKTLSERVFSNTAHGDSVKSEERRQELHQCQHCLDYLTTKVVRGWRNSKTAGEKEYMKTVVTRLNAQERELWNDAPVDEVLY